MSPSQSTQKSKSTGPRTPEGKARSCVNALHHGLTGRVVVLPSEDMNAYNAFCAELIADLAPETALERQYAQTFCDTQWRLNRARSFEDSMLSLGHFEGAGEIETDHPQVHAALTAARVFRENSKSFVNLSLYEQRLQRTLKESLRQPQELQTKRIAARQAALDAAVLLRNLHKIKGQSYDLGTDQHRSESGTQFVFSTAEIEAEARRQYRRADAENAQPFGYNLADYRESPLKQAA
ncbi:MAG: hypothetical protein ABSG41_07870 [Bryobacteraceae bacterium]|jgi:hypothetical protein